LPDELRQRLARESAYVSELSRCEIVIKEQARGKPIGLDIDAVIERAGLFRLPVGNGIHRRLRELPMIHRDPFDRMLVAQALATDLTLVTRDRRLRSYPVPTLW
jgi:PIN domain nuclease of toxin-antitoxin system